MATKGQKETFILIKLYYCLIVLWWLYNCQHLLKFRELYVLKGDFFTECKLYFNKSIFLKANHIILIYLLSLKKTNETYYF